MNLQIFTGEEQRNNPVKCQVQWEIIPKPFSHLLKIGKNKRKNILQD